LLRLATTRWRQVYEKEATDIKLKAPMIVVKGRFIHTEGMKNVNKSNQKIINGTTSFF
jgi:hypothetical protein